MNIIKRKTQKSFCVISMIILGFLVGFFYFSVFSAKAEKTHFEVNQEINSLNDKVESQKKKIEQLNKRIVSYQKNIIEFQKESKNLKNELAIIDLKIKEKESEIEKIQAEIDAMTLEIQNATLRILEKELVIQEKRNSIIIFLKKLETLRRRDIFDTLVKYDNFFDYYNEMKIVEDMQWGIQQNLGKIKIAKNTLIENKGNLEISNMELISLSEKQKIEHQTLNDQQIFKINLVNQTQRSESKYQKLLADVKAEKEDIDAEVSSLDMLVREKLKELANIGRSNQNFIWPVNSSRCCSTFFYDQNYPYRYLFEHAAIDIPAPQGDTIVASKDGYVARIRSPQTVGKGYAYMMIVHADGFSTVYGHINCAKVSEDTFVKQGDPIACVGGTPGTNGAGNLTTGAHLHFEVRKDGMPVNPLKYLP